MAGTGTTHFNKVSGVNGVFTGGYDSEAAIATAVYEGSTTWDASSIADGNEEAKEVTVTGAALGDFVLCSLSIDVADLVLSGAVTAADTVTCVLANNTGGAVDLASATLYARVLKRA